MLTQKRYVLYLKGFMMNGLADIVVHLTPEQQREVEDFARFLAHRGHHYERRDEQTSKRHITGEGWTGGLSHLKDRYASGVELQHDILNDWEACD